MLCFALLSFALLCFGCTRGQVKSSFHRVGCGWHTHDDDEHEDEDEDEDERQTDGERLYLQYDDMQSDGAYVREKKREKGSTRKKRNKKKGIEREIEREMIPIPTRLFVIS